MQYTNIKLFSLYSRTSRVMEKKCLYCVKGEEISPRMKMKVALYVEDVYDQSTK